MAALAKGLPILFIPEQMLIAPVWDDVVNHRCRRNDALSHAFRAQRIALQKQRAPLAPRRIISAGNRAAAYSIR